MSDALRPMSPSITSRSASLPAATVPKSSSLPITFAPFALTICTATDGSNPAPTRISKFRWSPYPGSAPQAGSTPAAIRPPASTNLSSKASRLLNRSSIQPSSPDSNIFRRCISVATMWSGMASLSRSLSSGTSGVACSATATVEVIAVPASTICRIVSSTAGSSGSSSAMARAWFGLHLSGSRTGLKSEFAHNPCSRLSMPSAVASRKLTEHRWPMTSMPCVWASSMIVPSASREICV